MIDNPAFAGGWSVGPCSDDARFTTSISQAFPVTLPEAPDADVYRVTFTITNWKAGSFMGASGNGTHVRYIQVDPTDGLGLGLA